ncbi:MAG: gliding motility-associated ABC transporter substrate-binding protein GldG [Flavobacteriales bacterium]|nr:gliding motility-associated ABC transporter substrate-binding protein GldG [Flavobacteriales bacterium]|tara:strand:- start:6005 stop:7723 length:1719 start_codon:yes stop_codon:yes gene_type:complete
MQNKLRILLFFGLVIVVNLIFSFIEYSFDLTLDKKHSISNETEQILSSLDDIIFVKVYLDGDFPSEFKHLQSEVKNLLSSFKSIAGSNLNFEFIDPNNLVDEKEKMNLFKQLVKDGLSPTDIEIRTSSSNSNQIIFPSALVYYKDKQRAVNFLKNSITKKPAENINESVESLEFEFITAIYQMLKTHTPKIAFLEGNGELNKDQVYDLSQSVLQDNNSLSYYYQVDHFNIKEFEIDSSTMDADISRQIEKMLSYKVIIIAKPTSPFNNLEKFLIDQYIMHGGKILWLIDAVKGSMDSLQTQNSFIALKNDINLDDQLFKYGVRINANLIEDLRSTKIPIVTGYSNNIPQQSYFYWPYFPLLLSDNNHSISKGLDALKCDFVSSIDTIKNKIKKTILLTSSKQSRINPAPAKVSLGILQDPPPIESYNKSSLPVAVLLKGEFESVFKNRILPKKQSLKFKEKSLETQMIIVSDGDIAKNSVSASGNILPLGYDRFNSYTYAGNKKFIMNAVHYLCDDIGITKLKSKEIKLRLLDKEKIKNNRSLIMLVNIILPLLLLLFCTVIFIKFKNKRYV